MLTNLLLNIYEKHPWIFRTVFILLIITQINFIFLVGYHAVDWEWTTAFLPTIFIVGYIFMCIFDMICYDTDDGISVLLSLINVGAFIISPITIVILYEIGLI